MPSVEMVAYGVLLVCCAGLGLSIVVEAAKMISVGAARAEVALRLTAKRLALRGAEGRLVARLEESRRAQAELDRLEAELHRLALLISSFLNENVEIVHEVGSPEAGSVMFVCDLVPEPRLGLAEPRRIIFSRPIWRFANLALVWADTPESARVQVQRYIGRRDSVGIGRMRTPSGEAVPASGDAGPVQAMAEPGLAPPRRPATLPPAIE